MKPWAKILSVLIWLCVLSLSFWRGAEVPFHDQWPLYEALRNTAAIIFAVVGAWLAIVYPERLRMSLRDGSPKKTDIENGGARVVKLLLPIVHSTIILAVVLCVGLIAPLIRGFAIVQSNVEIFRSISYMILASLTLLQIWTVVFTLVPASDMRSKVMKEERLRERTNSIFSRAKRNKK